MGLRLTLFAVAFNLLLWLSRSTLGALAHRTSARAALAGPHALAPTALLGLARLAPSRRDGAS
jgi:hypothetical protein